METDNPNAVLNSLLTLCFFNFYVVSTEPEKPGKIPIFRKVIENLEKSEKSFENAYNAGKSQGIIFD